MSSRETIAAISTGAQISAIGIIRLSGDAAIEIVSRLFRPLSGISMKDAEDRKLVFGGLYSADGELLDRCLCTVSHAPHSYTGEDTAELQCHGSPVLLRAVLGELFDAGARQALPGEFSKRAFLNGCMDLTAAEAVADLIDAESIEAAKNAAGQLSGAIHRKIRAIYDSLTDICSHYHAVLDYPDEDIEDFRLAAYTQQLNDAAASLEALLSTFRHGRLMRSGIPSVIVGRPNAGKSSLLNALLGYDRAIVTSVPGTTRDTIEEKVSVGRNILRLTDTAGIRETSDEVEKLGVERSRAALSEAELAIAVFDPEAGFADEDEELLKAALKTPHTIAVISKTDRSSAEALEAVRSAVLRCADRDSGTGEIGGTELSAAGAGALCGSGAPDRSTDCRETPAPAFALVEISSVTGDGIEALRACIEQMFPFPAVPSGEILTNIRQADAVRQALEYMRSALEAMNCGFTPDIVLTEAEGAMQALGELTGQIVREDVTNRIFARFCVGK